MFPEQLEREARRTASPAAYFHVCSATTTSKCPTPCRRGASQLSARQFVPVRPARQFVPVRLARIASRLLQLFSRRVMRRWKCRSTFGPFPPFVRLSGCPSGFPLRVPSPAHRAPLHDVPAEGGRWGQGVLCNAVGGLCNAVGGRQGFLCNAVGILVAPYLVEPRGPNAKALLYLVRRQTPPKGLDFLNLFLG